MRSAVKTGWGRRGTAAVLLVIGTAPAAAQTFPPARQRDSGGVARMIRIDEGPMAVLVDSVRVLMRVFDGEPITSPQSDTLRRKVEAMVMSINRLAGVELGPQGVYFERVGPDTPVEARRAGRRVPVRGWIGITTTGLTPHKEWIDGAHFVQYFDHPLVASVDRGSPAQRAGIMPGDTVIAYDGQDVVGRVINLSEMLRPDRTLAVTVRRRGEIRDYPVVVAKPPLRIAWRADVGPGGRGGVARVKVPRFPIEPGADDGSAWSVWTGVPRMLRQFTLENPEGPVFYFAKPGLFGASLMTVDPALAQSIGLSPGVLVRDVADGMAAAKAGLRVGDVVVAASGQPITSLNELQHAAVMRADQRTLTLQVIRDRKPRTINVSW